MGDQDFAVGVDGLCVSLEEQGPSSPMCMNMCMFLVGYLDLNNTSVHLLRSHQLCWWFKSTGCVDNFLSQEL